MLVTDQAKVIRTTVGDIRIAGRNTQGVMIFRVDKNEHVVSVARIDEAEEEIELEVDGDTVTVRMTRGRSEGLALEPGAQLWVRPTEGASTLVAA